MANQSKSQKSSCSRNNDSDDDQTDQRQNTNPTNNTTSHPAETTPRPNLTLDIPTRHRSNIQGHSRVSGGTAALTSSQGPTGTSTQVALPARLSGVSLEQRARLEETARQGMEEVDKREKGDEGNGKGKDAEDKGEQDGE